MVEWVVVDYQVQLFCFTTWLYTLTLTCQSLNVVDSMELHNIFLMLWQELRECDTLHHLTIHRHAEELLQGHLQRLEDDMKVSTSESPSLAMQSTCIMIRTHWVSFLRQWISGQIQTVYHTWR